MTTPFISVRVQTGFNISQAVPTRHLGISQTKELVEGSKFLYPVFAPISMYTDVELMSGKILEQSPENCFAGIH
jgi:hypothetical protein